MPGTNLTRDEARQRSELISVDSYAVSLDLTTGPDTFASSTTVRFSATEAGVGADTFIDLIARSVESIEFNGQSLDPARVWADSRIRLPELQAENTLTVDATCVYMNTGEGLHRFVDPADGAVYLGAYGGMDVARRVFALSLIHI